MLEWAFLRSWPRLSVQPVFNVTRHGAIRTEDKMLDFGAGIGTFALPLMYGGTDVLSSNRT
jgi:hypothetical protein